MWWTSVDGEIDAHGIGLAPSEMELVGDGGPITSVAETSLDLPRFRGQFSVFCDQVFAFVTPPGSYTAGRSRATRREKPPHSFAAKSSALC